MATRLNRQIGYIKPKESLDLKISQEIKLEEIIVSEIPDLIKLKSKKITSWIKSHPAIKWSFICKSVGIDKGNFQKILKSDSPIIKIENIIKLEKQLKKYGYE